MQQVIINVYNYNELEGKAKERARIFLLECETSAPLFEREFSATVHALEEMFNIRFTDLSRYCALWDDEDGGRDVYNMNFARTVAYINNRFNMAELPYKITSKARALGRPVCVSIAKDKYVPAYFTGFYLDCVLLDSYNTFIEYARKNPKAWALCDFFDILARNVRDELENLYDEIESEEFLRDIAINNNYLFFENGEFYKASEMIYNC